MLQVRCDVAQRKNTKNLIFRFLIGKIVLHNNIIRHVIGQNIFFKVKESHVHLIQCEASVAAKKKET